MSSGEKVHGETVQRRNGIAVKRPAANRWRRYVHGETVQRRNGLRRNGIAPNRSAAKQLRRNVRRRNGGGEMSGSQGHSSTRHVHTSTMAIGDTPNNGGDDDNNAIVDKLTIYDLPLMPETTEPLFNYTELPDPRTGIHYKIPYNNDAEKKHRKSKTTPNDDLDDIRSQRELYVRKKLNPEQLAVFEHVTANPNDIVLLEGGPGTGKTFTMLTVANHFVEAGKPPNVVIFKRDTVHDYQFSANGYTFAQFIMRIFKLHYLKYKKLERKLNEPMSVEHFLNTVVYLTRTLTICPKTDDFRHPLLILDLYTVKSKPFLLIIMMTLHRYRIGAVICGDKNQLQDFYNSTHAGRCSAYDIVSSFLIPTKIFNLSCNQRFDDTTYIDNVKFIGTLSNDRALDERGYALVSAMFYKNLIRNVDPADTILAKYPSELTETVVKMVTDKNIPKTDWLIKQSDNNYVSPLANNKNLRYLKFLPLIVGNPYYVNECSERMLCRLESIDLKENHQTREQDTVSVCMPKTNKVEEYKWGKCSSVMFEKHLAYLLKGDDDSLSGNSSSRKKSRKYSSYDLYNFPLYPAFSMTIHKSMGRTIRSRVSLNLKKSTYQSLYVAISRVTSSENINSVVIPNKLQHLISVLLNFDVTDLKPLKIDLVEEKISKRDYMYYNVSLKKHGPFAKHLENVAKRSLSLNTIKKREAARKKLKALVLKYGIQPRELEPNTNQAADDKSAAYRTTLQFLLKMKNTITSLASLTPLESRVWIHEFLNEPKTLEYMRSCNKYIFSNPIDFKLQVLNKVCEITKSNTYKQGETSMDFMKKTSTKKCKEDFKKDPHLLKEWKILSETNDKKLKCVQVFIYNLVHRGDRGKDIYKLLKERLEIEKNKNNKNNNL